MKHWHIAAARLFIGAWIAIIPARSRAASFAVDSIRDKPDAVPGDGVCATERGSCTLRAAIEEANALPGGDAITLPLGRYKLSAGVLDITDDLILTGAGVTTTSVDGERKSEVFHIASPAHVTIAQLTVQNGRVNDFGGGGFFNDAGATLTLTDVECDRNEARDSFGGGGVNGGTATLTNVVFRGNKALGFGNSGGGFTNAGSATLTNVTFLNNHAWSGGSGGLENTGTITVSDATFTGNTTRGASALGGGCANTGGATFTDVIFTGNDASGVFCAGGGLANRGSATLTNVTFASNRARGVGGGGGGLHNEGAASAALTNVTFSENGVAGLQSGGGGIDILGGTVSLTNVTFAANQATGTHSYAGTLSNLLGSGSVSAVNTIVAGNSNCAGALQSLGHNIDSGNTCGFASAGDLINTDARLGALADHGGFTPTIPLLGGSPAIDAGDDTACPGTDQRGAPRPADGNADGTSLCDVGAYEVQP